MLETLLIGLLLLGIVYVFVALILYFTQEKFIFFPVQLTQDFEFEHFENAEEVFLEVDKNTRIHALHFRVNQPKGIILYFHGNARANKQQAPSMYRLNLDPQNRDGERMNVVAPFRNMVACISPIIYKKTFLFLTL